MGNMSHWPLKKLLGTDSVDYNVETYVTEDFYKIDTS
jgi:hypothetical protein